MTPFDNWLRALGGSAWGLTIPRGLPFVFSLALQGDFTDSVLTGSIRLAPDTAGSVLVSFTVTGPIVLDEVTTFGIGLTAGQTAALPADADADGVTELAYDLLFTPSGGTQQRLIGGVAQVLGKVTNAS